MSNYTTFDKISNAFMDVFGRKRSRYEVENGVTYTEVDGVKVFESVRVIHTSNTKFEDQSIDGDKVILTNDVNYEIMENNFCTDSLIHYFIDGKFVGKKVVEKVVKVNDRGGRAKRMVEVKCNHSVAYAKYKVVDIEYFSEDKLKNTITLERV